MSNADLQKRLILLEQQVSELRDERTKSSAKADWRRSVGMFDDMQELFAEGMKLREADRKKARRRPRKVVRAQS